jgi:DNA-directed RNA polymerase
MVNLGIGEMTTREYKFGFEREDELKAAVAEGLPVDEISAEEVAEEPVDLDTEAETGNLSNSSGEEPTAFAKRFSHKKPTSSTQDTWVWLPLTFPSIPQRVSIHLHVPHVRTMLTSKQGDFDVTRLRDSKYFFS